MQGDDTLPLRVGLAGPPRRQAREAAAQARLPLLVLVFVVSLILPLYIYLGSLRLTPFLLVLLPAFVPVFLLWLVGGRVRHKTADYLVLFYCLWSGLALAVAHGLSNAIEPIGIVFVQTLGSYLLGRCLVRSKESLRRVLYVFLALQLLILPFAMVEAVTAKALYLDIFRAIGPTYANVVKDARLGLDRVQGPFEHPILFGIYCASLLAAVYYLFDGARSRLPQAAAVSLLSANAVLSLSSGALLAMTVQFGMIAWAKIFAGVAHRWRLFVLLLCAVYLTIDLLSNRTPFDVFVDYLTFNSSTAYNRILIWQYGSAEVMRHPLFGIGLNEWTRAWFMSTSIDNFWLVTAIRYGLPGFLALAGAFVLILVGAGRRVGLDEETGRLRLGMTISFVGTAFAISTVHIWDATLCWFMFLLGSSVWLTEAGEAPRSRPSRRREERAPPPADGRAARPDSPDRGARAASQPGPLLGNLRGRHPPSSH